MRRLHPHRNDRAYGVRLPAHRPPRVLLALSITPESYWSHLQSSSHGLQTTARSNVTVHHGRRSVRHPSQTPRTTASQQPGSCRNRRPIVSNVTSIQCLCHQAAVRRRHSSLSELCRSAATIDCPSHVPALRSTLARPAWVSVPLCAMPVQDATAGHNRQHEHRRNGALHWLHPQTRSPISGLRIFIKDLPRHQRNQKRSARAQTLVQLGTVALFTPKVAALPHTLSVTGCSIVAPELN